MSNDRMPPAGHTDDYGNWHWGPASARLGRISAETNRRQAAGLEKMTAEQAAAHAYTLDQEAGRTELSPAEEAARALWADATPEPEQQPQQERSRDR